MKKRKKKPVQITLRCPYCGRTARLRPASYVYGEDTLDAESFLYVCDGILAHRALDALWKQGYMTRHSAYIWLQTRLCLKEKDMHIGKFSDYYCDETIRECEEFIRWHKEGRKGGKCA